MKLLILSALTGGGHDMRAFALKDWWTERGNEAEVFHPLESSFAGYRLGCQLYNLIQKKFPILHYAYFHFLEHASIHRDSKKIIGSPRYVQKISTYRPDLIVSMHAHLNHGYFELSKLTNFKPKFAVFCGELADGYGFSKHWVNPLNDLFVSPYTEGSLAAQRRGMPIEKILVSGPLLRKPFYSQQDIINKEEILKKFELDDKLPIYLLGTGANGVNRHLPVIKALCEGSFDAQVVALCGKNKKTYEAVLALSKSSRLKLLPLPKLNAESMFELLNIASWMLARPGAGLTTEAVVTGCPLIFDLSGGCMPQEKINLNFWKSRQGKVLNASSPEDVTKIIQSKEPIPSLRIPVQTSPDLLLKALERLASETDDC
jgi:processive 1,2-diacylglycerol beta-glucosyltransferase